MRRLPAAALALLLAYAALAATTEESLQKAVVGVASYDEWPFIRYNAEGNNVTGFLAPIIDALCEGASLDCELKPLPSLKDMVPSVQNGSVDFIVHILSETEARAELVDFVHPGFYSAGVALYTTPTEGGILAAAGGWDSLSGANVCFVEGYYATDALVATYGLVPVELPSLDEAIAGVGQGKCVAAAYDTGQVALGLPQAPGITPAMNAAYAIPVAKNNTELRRRLSAATVELLDKGNDSLLLQWEQEYLTDQGVLANQNLYDVVKAITYFE